MAEKNVSNKKQLKVKRETYTKSGKEFFSYFVEGEIRGKKMKAYLTPDGIRGYDLLDLVFLGEETADLRVTSNSMIGEDGVEVAYTTYECFNIDKETGEEFSCKLKPMTGSDKKILELFCR